MIGFTFSKSYMKRRVNMPKYRKKLVVEAFQLTEELLEEKG